MTAFCTVMGHEDEEMYENSNNKIETTNQQQLPENFEQKMDENELLKQNVISEVQPGLEPFNQDDIDENAPLPFDAPQIETKLIVTGKKRSMEPYGMHLAMLSCNASSGNHHAMCVAAVRKSANTLNQACYSALGW